MRKNVDIYVFDGQTEKILSVLSNKANNQLKYFDDEVTEQLNRDFTFQFSAPANHKNSKHLVEGNLVGYFDDDSNFQLFQIYKIEEERNGRRVTKTIYAEHEVYENVDNIVTDLRVVDQGPEMAMPKALNGSRWVPGQVDALAPQTINYYYTDSMENIRATAEKYKGELRYRVLTDGRALTSRLVDLLFRRGADTGLSFEYKRNLESVKRTVEASGIKTALYGRGSGEEIEETGGYTRKVTFADVEWKVANGDPVDKPLGQEWVGDIGARTLYGRAGGTRHRFGTFDYETTDPVELLTLTWEQLQLVNKPLVTYELTVKDLAALTGQQSKRFRLGDTVYVIDRDLGLLIEARIIEVKSGLNGKNSQVVLGNFIPDIADYNKKLEKATQSLNDRKGVWDKEATSPVTDNDFEDIQPPAPTGFSAHGIFRSISVEWDYVASGYIAAYEVYASKVKDFTADPSNLVFRGKAGGYLHAAQTNETWYFRVRAVNTHGTASALTPQFYASTLQITDVDYEELSIGDAVIANVSADKITFGTLDGNQANIVNLNADNIVGGKVKAEFVEIGGNTTFAAGYDPTKKAEYVVGDTSPSNLNAIWVDTTDPNNVIWKAYDKTLGIWRTGPSGPRGPQGLQGIQGPQGDQGIQGPAGADGVSSFTHIAYATSSDGTQGFSTSDSVGKSYIGMYVDTTPTDSNNPADYNWTLIKGADGSQGIPGKDGADGQTPYLHIAYATSSNGSTGFSITDPTNKTYIGTYTDFTAEDSTDPSKYSWAKFQGPTGPQGPQGVQGPAGADGKSLYTWVKYADTSTGGGMSDTPAGKKYIGLAYNKTVATESSTASDYTWSLIQGDQGVQGPPGSDGVTTYTWVKYADDDQGNGLSDSPTGKRYLGLAYNKTTASESTNKADYTWSPLYDNVQVGGRNLLAGTSESDTELLVGQYYTVINEGVKDTLESYKLAPGDTVTFRVYIKADAVYGGAARISLFRADATYGTYIGNYVAAGTEGFSSITVTIPSDRVEVLFAINKSDVTAGTSGTFRYSKAKAEIGNVSSDWTPAPEDYDKKVSDAYETITTEYNTAISNNQDSILLSVDKTIYGDTTDPNDTGGVVGEMKQYTANQISISEDSFNIKLSEINTTTDGHQASLDEIYSYFKFLATGLNIGKSDSPLQINISNEQMDFIDNGITVAYVNGQKMYIDSLEVLTNIIVGNHKIEKYDNNITLVKWVGE